MAYAFILFTSPKHTNSLYNLCGEDKRKFSLCTSLRRMRDGGKTQLILNFTTKLGDRVNSQFHTPAALPTENDPPLKYPMWDTCK
jgi:hypothetical protein